MIKKCETCGNKPHTQDDLHGKGMRVFNENPKKDNKDSKLSATCTVCGTQNTGGYYETVNQSNA